MPSIELDLEKVVRFKIKSNNKMCTRRDYLKWTNSLLVMNYG